MDEFEIEMKSGFLEEAAQLLVDAEQCFLVLETSPNDVPTLEKIFRIAHNIKGSSKAVGFDALGAFTHEFESFLLKCKNGLIAITPSVVSLLLKGNDHIRNWLDALKGDLNAVIDNSALIQEILEFKPDAEASQDLAEVEAPVEVNFEKIAEQFPEEDSTGEEILEAQVTASLVEVPADEFTALAELTEKSLTDGAQVLAFTAPTAVTTPPPVSSVVETAAPAAKANPPAAAGAANVEESIRVSVQRLEKLLDFVGELVILQTVLSEQSYLGSPQTLRKTVQQLGKVTKEVQNISMSLRMVPLKQTFQKMQRIVRDTSSALGKKVQLVLEGDETEVDKTVLEALSDPLVHLIRNAVDHGIENPADRLAKGKSEMGEVKLRAYHQGGKLVIEVRDNGGGIPAERLKQKAIEKGILKPNQVLSEKEAIHLIFHPGFSTKSQVTEVSGRGVGMDVVKTNIDQLQGDIDVETVLGQGSVFKIFLPLTLAIIDGMIVLCEEEKFIIPLTHVHETVKVEAEAVNFATGIGEVLLLRGENVPVIRMGIALGKSKKQKLASEQIAIIVRTLGQPFAVFVDDVIGKHQVVVKKLGNELQNIKGYTGSAILGDGKPALILELSDLVQTSVSSIKRQAG